MAEVAAASDDIDDQELSLILDRTRLFTTRKEVVSAEGALKENDDMGANRSPAKGARGPEKGKEQGVVRVHYALAEDVVKEGRM